MSYFVDPKQRSDAEWFCEEEEWNEACFDESRGIQESKEVKQNVWYFNYPFSSQFTPKHILCICILYLLVTSSFSSFCLLSENNIKAFAKILNNKYLIHFLQCHGNFVLQISVMEITFLLYHWFFIFQTLDPRVLLPFQSEDDSIQSEGTTDSILQQHTETAQGFPQHQVNIQKVIAVILVKDPFLQFPFILIWNCFNWCCFWNLTGKPISWLEILMKRSRERTI